MSEFPDNTAYLKRFAILLIIVMQSVAVFSEPRHIMVAAEGSGEFTQVREAVNSIGAKMSDAAYDA